MTEHLKKDGGAGEFAQRGYGHAEEDGVVDEVLGIAGADRLIEVVQIDAEPRRNRLDVGLAGQCYCDPTVAGR